MKRLPRTGTAELLSILDRYVPDDFINENWNVRPVRGPRRYFSAAQLWRTHLLTVLTPVHTAAILLLPLISWVTPANVFEGALLVPSLRYCQRRWAWWPKIVVADMSYMGVETKPFAEKIGG